MIEFDVDMDYLLDYDELDKVVLNDENGEHEPMEFVPKDTETAGNHSCASCPEMDNPDSYIAHLQSALRWHDEHVPRPTNPRNTCVVLQGEKPPEEVLFVREDGVTHYLPEDAGTCKDVCASVSEFTCSECGFNCDLTSWISLFDGDDGRHRHHHHGTPNFCPNCGAKVVGE